MEKARLHTLRGLELARRYGVRSVLGWLYWNQAVMALAQSDWTGSETHFKQSMQEVAEIFIISPRTVNHHLSNIFNRLDVPGRARLSPTPYARTW
jgi:regulatory LuxR family protein